MCSGSSGSAICDALKSIGPLLSRNLYKGQCGRIAVFGGSIEYTGAPYYAAISSLKTGSDLAYIVCSTEASSAIKSYSPELIVYPTLYNQASLRETLDSLVPRLHAAIVGPGFGRSTASFDIFKMILHRLKSANLPIVIDADGLYFISKDIGLVQNYSPLILTPNAVEFDRIFSAAFGKEAEDKQNPENVKLLCNKLGNVAIIKKGEYDVISNGIKTLTCETESSGRRCGGQGDLLSGALGTFIYWALEAFKHHNRNSALQDYGPLLIASYGACLLTKQCNRLAFEKYGRSTTTEDMIEVIYRSVKNIFD